MALIISSDLIHRDKIAEIARNIGLQPVLCSSLTDARTLLAQQTFHLVLCGDDLPDCNLRTALSVLSTLTGGIPVIVISCIADWEAYMKAISAGAFDYIAFPPDPVESERILRLALDYNSQPQPVTRLAHGPMSDSQPPYHPQNRI